MVTETREPAVPATQEGERMASVVREAWLATSQLGEEVAPETRETAFKLVLEAMLRNGGSAPTVAEAPNGDLTSASKSEPDPDDFYSTPDLRMDAISLYLEIAGDQVELLFAVDVAEPVLQVVPGKLEQAKAQGTREIALLVLGARTALGMDTQMDDIRKVAERYKRYDPGNFAKTLQSSPELVVLGKPRSSHRTVRLRGKGVDAARELVQRLVAE